MDLWQVVQRGRDALWGALGWRKALSSPGHSVHYVSTPYASAAASNGWSLSMSPFGGQENITMQMLNERVAAYVGKVGDHGPGHCGVCVAQFFE